MTKIELIFPLKVYASIVFWTLVVPKNRTMAFNGVTYLFLSKTPACHHTELRATDVISATPSRSSSTVIAFS